MTFSEVFWWRPGALEGGRRSISHRLSPGIHLSPRRLIDLPTEPMKRRWVAVKAVNSVSLLLLLKSLIASSFVRDTDPRDTRFIGSWTQRN